MIKYDIIYKHLIMTPDKIDPIEIIDGPADVSAPPIQLPFYKLVTSRVCQLASKIMLFASSYSRQSIILAAQFFFVIVILIVIAIYLQVFIKTYRDIDIYTSTQGNVYPCFYVVRNGSVNTNICADNYTFINTTDTEGYMCDNVYYCDVIGYCRYDNSICNSASFCNCLQQHKNYNITSGFGDHFVIYSLYYVVIAIIIILCISATFFYFIKKKLFSVDEKTCALIINRIGCAAVCCVGLLFLVICIWLPIVTAVTKPDEYCDIVCEWHSCYWIDAPINMFIINQCCSANYYGLYKQWLNFDSTPYTTDTYIYYCVSVTFIPIAITFATCFSSVLYIPDSCVNDN
jgi:hypothetical protein